MDAEVTLTEKQAEYMAEAHHRWNFAVGAVPARATWRPSTPSPTG